MGRALAVSAVDVSSTPQTMGAPAVVRVVGDLDIAGVPEVRSALLSAEAAQPDALAIDLAEVSHLDSTGLRILLDGARRAAAAGRRFIIVAPPEGPVGRILRLTLLLEHLEVVPELGAASR